MNISLVRRAMILGLLIALSAGCNNPLGGSFSDEPSGTTTSGNTGTTVSESTDPTVVSPSKTVVKASATYAPSDGLAMVSVIVIPKNSSSTPMGTGKTVEVRITSGTATLSGASNCRTGAAALCQTATDIGGGQYLVTAVSSTVGSVTFSATCVETSGDVAANATGNVTFDDGQFLGVNGYTLSGATSITSAYAGKNLYVTAGTITFDTTTSTTNNFALGDVFMRGGTLKHTSTSAATLYRMILSVNSLNLQGTASINTDGLGYPGGYSFLQPNGAPTNSAAAGLLGTSIPFGTVGGSHGGQGGFTGAGSSPGEVFDNIIDPSYPGGGSGGAGGGVVKITSAGLCSFTDTASISSAGAGDGGAGGTVFLNCSTFTTSSTWTGTIKANGGTYWMFGSGGGGGRISLISSGTNGSADWAGNLIFPTNSTTFNTFTTSVTATGATTGSSGAGAAGTIFLKNSSQTYGSLIVKNGSNTIALSGKTILPSIAGTITQLAGTTATVTGAGLTTKLTNLYANTFVRPDVTSAGSVVPTSYTGNLVKLVSANDATTLTLNDTTGLAANGVGGGDDTTFRTLHIFDTMEVSGGAVIETKGDIYLVSGAIVNPGTSVEMNGLVQFNGSGALNYQGFTNTYVYSQTSGTNVFPTQNFSNYAFSISGGSSTINGNLTNPTTLTVSGTGALVVTGTVSAPSVVVTGTGSLTAPTLTVTGGGDITVSSTSSSALIANTITANNLTLSGAGTKLKHQTTDTSNTYALNVTLTGNLNLSSSASIDVSGIGYVSSYGFLQPLGNPGTNSIVTGFGRSSDSGASHGGKGGCGTTTCVAADTYDDLTNPQYPGGGAVLAGGGVARITATGSCNFSGSSSIKADANLTGTQTSGAGGSIYLNCASISTSTWTGNITAIGANGYFMGGYCNGGGAAGGGGRIAIITTSGGLAGWDSDTVAAPLRYPSSASALNIFVANVKAKGGNPAYQWCANDPVWGSGGAGTIYVKHSAQTYGSLIVNNTGVTVDTGGRSGVTFLPSIYGDFTASGTTPTVTVNSTPLLTSKFTNVYASSSETARLRLDTSVPIDSSALASYPKITANSGTTLTLGSAATNTKSFRTLHVFDNLEVMGGAVLQTNGDIYLVSGPISNPTTSINMDGLLAFNGTATLDYPGFNGEFHYTKASGSHTLPFLDFNNYRLALTGGSLKVSGNFTHPSALTVSGTGVLTVTGTLTAPALTISGSAAITAPTVTITGGGDIDITSTSSSALVANTITARNLTMSGAGGKLKHQTTDGTTMYALNATLTGALALSSSASIDVSGLGYITGTGFSQPSGVPTSSTVNGFVRASDSGASHGGKGGCGVTTCSASDTYDDYANPKYPGGGAGMSGGGVARITAAGACTFAGTSSIKADADLTGNHISGAGGSVYLNCASFSTSSWTGQISANGADGYFGGGFCNGLSAGGGGGRIALITSAGGINAWDGGSGSSLSYPTTASAGSFNTFKGLVTAKGGAAITRWCTTDTDGGNGAAGSIYVKHSGQTYGSLIYNNSGVTTNARYGTTALVSLAGTLSSAAAAVATIASTTPALTAKYTNLFAGVIVRPDVAYDAATPLNVLDDNLYSISSNTDTTLTMTGAIAGVTTPATFNTVTPVDYIDISGGAQVSTNGEIWLMTGCDLHSAAANILDVAAGSKLAGTLLGAPNCSQAIMTTDVTTISFPTYKLAP